MKSKLTFGLGYKNAPIIEVSVESTEDLRDKVATQFAGNLSSGSFLTATGFSESYINDQNSKIGFYIVPIPENFDSICNSILRMLEKLPNNNSDIQKRIS